MRAEHSIEHDSQENGACQTFKYFKKYVFKVKPCEHTLLKYGHMNNTIQGSAPCVKVTSTQALFRKQSLNCKDLLLTGT